MEGLLVGVLDSSLWSFLGARYPSLLGTPLVLTSPVKIALVALRSLHLIKGVLFKCKIKEFNCQS